MSESDARAAVLAELGAHGYPLLAADPDADLIGHGVNSAALIQILSALEDRFDVDLELEALFAGPVTVSGLAAELVRATGASGHAG
ncbi:acyl carrier protein [Streptomyces sp. CC208A]|uniref:acyl carrier protein n=1 Tax=Streptomyces sp. CC208A TaxID=3044573 RepID=UPI0024A9EC69|nr:acyl carrier protein [Streptomyces sp. CC208A]